MSSDVVGAGSRWIPEDEYSLITTRVPIVCVDILLRPLDQPSQVGLIHRETYGGGSGWCLVGGAVLRNESLIDAVVRHTWATLGDRIVIDKATLELATVGEYFSERRADALYDPRKHAIALTYTGMCVGEAEAAGEASAFSWFHIDELKSLTFGFGQDRVVAQVVESFKT